LNVSVAERVRAKTEDILARFDLYSGHLHFPRDWGERPVRAWMGVEVFRDILAWPLERIVFGEMFDLLLIDSGLNPRVYVETKAPRTLTREKQIDKILKKAVDLARLYPTIDQVLVTDAIRWIRFDVKRNLSWHATIRSDQREWLETLTNLEGADYP